MIQRIITTSCQHQGLSIVDLNDTHLINATLPFGYGFWTKYLSMSQTLDINLLQFGSNIQGYTIVREINQNNKTKILLYYDQNPKKTLKLISFENDIAHSLLDLAFDTLIEGQWIYYSFSYTFQALQFIAYSITNLYMQQIVIQVNHEQLQINFGGNYAVFFLINQFVYGSQDINLAFFQGWLSQLNYQYSAIFFTSKNQFIDYINTLNQPQRICMAQIYETSRITNFLYDSGLIVMESWVQLEYYSVILLIQQSLNVSTSVFGIEFVIQLQNYNLYQPIISLHYVVYQSYNLEMFNGISFGILEFQNKDFQLPKRNVSSFEAEIHVVNQNLRQWHYVQIYYGFENELPVQYMKITFSDWSDFQLSFNKKIYPFQDRNLILRAGNLNDISQAGVSVQNSLSQIQICEGKFLTFTKKCHHSCQDCDGPNSKDCLSCILNRYLDNRQCKCIFGYIESNEGVCKKFEILYRNAEQIFIASHQQLQQIGYFQFGQSLLSCPEFQQFSKNIQCIECLINPETFATNLVCKSDYIVNAYGQYEIQIRDSRNVELYILNEKDMEIRLCIGCLQLCVSNKDDLDCFFNKLEGKYIKCQEGYFQDNGRCSICASQCKGCSEADKCTSCQRIQLFNPLKGECLNCPTNCETCTFDEQHNIICLTCLTRHSLFKGKCMPCGLNCQTCQYMLDKDNQYYNRCIVCLDSSQYFLELNAINCGLNTIAHCKYVIQFHGNFYVRQQANTVLHLFQRRDLDKSQIYTYCALCDGLGTVSLLKGQCYFDPKGYILDSDGKICISGYQFDDAQNTQVSWLNLNCIIGNLTNSSRQYSLLFGCQYLIQNCNACSYDHCVQCFPGFYPDISDGQCHECPKILKCLRCQQQSKLYQNGWKIWLRYISNYLFPQQFYSAVFGNEYGDQLEIICTECNPGFELYKQQCIPECPTNCKTCTKVGMQNYCVECHSYNGKLLSLYEGTCIECPRYCSLCYPKSDEQIKSANPYFSTNDTYLSTTHTCLLLEAGLNSEEYTYNVNIKQFIKYSEEHIDPNSVIMNFNLYCDLDQFQKDLQLQQDKKSFLSSNVRIDEIISINKSQTNFNRIENDYLFVYLGTQQIKQVDLQFTFLQDCTINQTSYLFTILTQKVYFINQATLTLNGNGNRLIIYENLDISGFDIILLKNMNINVMKNDRKINLQSFKSLTVEFDQVTLISSYLFSFQLTNIQSLMIQQFTLLNSKVLASFFNLINQNVQLFIRIQNLSIFESHFEKSNWLSLGNCTSQILLSNITIFKSNFTESTLIETQNQYQLTLSNLIIEQSTFIQCTPLFKTNLAQTFNLDYGFVTNSLLKNTVFFLLGAVTQIQTMSFTESQLLNSSIFYAYNKNIELSLNLTEFTIIKLVYDSQILYAYSTNENSKIILTKWALCQMHFQSNIEVNSQKFLIYLQADTISLKQINIQREQGLSEFYLGQAININIQNFYINQSNFLPSIITNNECEIDFSFTQFRNVLFIEKSQNIRLQDITIINLIIFDIPLIQIISIETQQKKRQEFIKIDNLVVSGCVIQKTQTENQISILHITSQQTITIQLLSSNIFFNFYHVYQTESESDSALALYFMIENGNFIIDQCIFQGNYISHSQNSLISVFAQDATIRNTIFLQNNHFSEQLLKHINWGYRQDITLDYLSNYFPVQSLSGNGYFSIDYLDLQNVTIIGSNAQQAGCLLIRLKNDANVQIVESLFSQIKSSTKGGCLYFEDKALSINITILSSSFNSTFAFSEGGAIYFQPLTQSVNLNLINITIKNTFALTGAFINLQFQNSLTQILLITDCYIVYNKEGLVDFFNSFRRIDTSLLSSIFVIQEGQIIVQNLVAQLFLIGLMESIYTSKVSLTSIVIENSHYWSKPGLLMTCSNDDFCKISIDGLIVKYLSYYNQILVSKKVVSKVLELDSSCLNSKTLKNVDQDFLEEQIFGKDEISEFILIKGIKSDHQISCKNSYITHNNCTGCQNGLIQLNFEQYSENSNFAFENIQFSQNNCGINGCLTFLLLGQSFSSYQKNIIINKLICSNNVAINGACIFSRNLGLLISNSLMIGNQAKNLGGGIYYSGDVKNLILYDNLISNNVALSGSSLYIENNSSPDLTQTNNYIESATQSISSLPTQLSLTINNYQNILHNYYTKVNEGYLFKNNETILTLPSGQEILKYQYFNLKSQKYEPLNLTFRIVPLNDYQERVKNLTSSFCNLSSGYLNFDQLVLTNNYTNYNQKEFDTITQDYNFDDLIIYFGANNSKSNLILQFYCSSIKIPIYGTVFPYQIINYISNYTLQMNIQTFECQLGEHKDLIDSSCHLCEVKKKQYSVRFGAITCQYMNEDTTLDITPAQLKLKNGFWRPFINSEIIEKCLNKIENCLGGWMQGDITCSTGQIGARCESCDSYNIRGQGYYSSKQLYICGQCEELGKQLLYILATSIWMLISINFTTKGIESMIMEIQKNRIGKIQLIINHNKQTGPYMKMFTNYLQNIAIIINFNVDIPQGLKSYFTIFGNPSQQLLISTDCFMASQFSLNIMYVKIIQCLINPFIFGLLYLFFYLILVSFSKTEFNKIIVTTTILYLFFYFQPQAMQQLIQNLSYQTISGIDWIQANLSYQFFTDLHLSWIPYLIGMIILLGFLIPAVLLIKIFLERKKLFRHQFRNSWGFLVLEYQNKAYYWEFMRILTRELMIVSITFFQDDLLLKCLFIFFIIFLYQLGTALVIPFKTTNLNKLDVRSSIICLITIMAIISDSQSQNIQNLIMIIIILPNFYLFLSYLTTLFLSYLQAYEEILDKVKDIVRKKFSNQIEKIETLKSLMQNKGDRRKVVRARFQLIKQYLLSKSKTNKFMDSNDKSIPIMRGRMNTGTNRFSFNYEGPITQNYTRGESKTAFLNKN